MPIPKHLRHLYRGKAYEAFRTKLLDRAGNACEECKAPHMTRVFRVNQTEFAGWWWSEAAGLAHDPSGNVHQEFHWISMMETFPNLSYRGILIKVGPSHLNHTPGDLDLSHSRARCQRCHILYDVPIHVVSSKKTRQIHKDLKRPLLVLQEAV